MRLSDIGWKNHHDVRVNIFVNNIYFDALECKNDRREKRDKYFE